MPAVIIYKLKRVANRNYEELPPISTIREVIEEIRHPKYNPKILRLSMINSSIIMVVDESFSFIEYQDLLSKLSLAIDITVKKTKFARGADILSFRWYLYTNKDCYVHRSNISSNISNEYVTFNRIPIRNSNYYSQIDPKLIFHVILPEHEASTFTYRQILNYAKVTLKMGT